MNRSIFAILVATAALTTSCSNSEPTTQEQRPFRDGCKKVIDQPFQFVDADGGLQIQALEIGGTESSDNFANRGDIIVKYADTDRITVEMCRFTMAASDELAEEDFDRLEIWAYDATGSPKKPSSMKEEDNCIDPDGTTPWLDNCKIRVYYDGQTQLGRAGADLRVTIPRDYIYGIEVTTEDNDQDDDYQNRGSVCIEGLAGSAEVELGSGEAFVILADDLNPMPTCPADLYQECVDVGWDRDTCPCITGMYTFASTKITTQDAASADMTVDVPATNPAFWAALQLTNEGQQTKGTAPACADDDIAPGARCDVCVDPSAGAFTIDAALGSDALRDPWRNRGDLNFPGEPADTGAGYLISLTSKVCQAVPATEDPDDFVGLGKGSEQDVNERGNMSVCSGCLRGQSCEDLLSFQ